MAPCRPNGALDMMAENLAVIGRNAGPMAAAIMLGHVAEAIARLRGPCCPGCGVPSFIRVALRDQGGPEEPASVCGRCYEELLLTGELMVYNGALQ